MLKRKIFTQAAVLTTFAASLSLTGCAFTNTTIPMKYKLPQDKNILHAKYPVKINVSVSDSRADGARVIFHKINLYHDTTTGTFSTKKPISSIVQKGLRDGLISMGYQVGKKNAPYYLDAEILNIDDKSVMGIFEALIRIKIEINLHVYRKADGSMVWQKIVEGTGKRKLFLGTGSDFRDVFNTAVTNAIRSMQYSNSFVDALRPMNKNWQKIGNLQKA